ncbi:hypothetical protein QRD40_06100 [Comamonas sp. Y6]|uniref:Uncharacterized protein n=1 Tax=Comamonas resistens TaxID=3046670 RepID=A0ABY8SQH2_9BURK|nr:hypothetical protein [Comamonas resistens]MDL5035920.1 hypothetical protein [Comamonas resistens]WHS65323.1 hypothetical protein QMY55_23065 [Comamonas resistens]
MPDTDAGGFQRLECTDFSTAFSQNREQVMHIDFRLRCASQGRKKAASDGGSAFRPVK